MKTIRNICLFLICLINFGNKSSEIEQGNEQFNDAIAGYTAGQFNVTDAGTATYSIPIIVPPGTAGMQPTLSLSYSNQGGNGLIGLGWSVQGVSVISRSKRTLAQDDEIKGVNLDGTDTYSLDGERLVLVGGDYGADGSEYRTEQNMHLKIEAYGHVNGSPEKFRVWTKSGLIMEYGYTEDSKIEAQGSSSILFWYVTRIIDTKGNYIAFSYFEDNTSGEYRPIAIDYTLNESGTLSPFASVIFSYEDREDTSNKYASGIQIKTTKRLHRIECKYKGEIAREYRLSYEYSSNTNVSLLKSVTECGKGGSCFNPTTFDWIEEKSFNFSATATDSIPTTALDDNDISLQSGDWDGDGVQDLLTINPITGNHTFFKNNKQFSYVSSTSNLITSSSNTNLNSIKQKTPRVLDINGDGFSDIMFYDPDEGNNIWFLNNGNEFPQLSFTNKGQLVPKSEFEKVLIDNSYKLIQPYFGDYNGDGLTDLMLYLWTNGRNHFFLNNSKGTSLNFSSVRNSQNVISGTQLIGGTDVQIIPGDWNGDGLLDLMRYKRGNGANRWFINTGGGGDPSFVHYNSLIAGNEIDGNTNVQIQFGDWNGDGLSDLMWHNKSGGATRWYYNKGDLSLGSNAFVSANHILDESLLAGTDDDKFLYILDFNGDGISDIFWYDKANGDNRWFQNNGQCDFSTPLNPSNSSQPGFINPISEEDIDGGTALIPGPYSCKGLVDVMWYDKDNGSNKWFQSNLEIANYLSRVTNGHGLEIEVDYKSLLNDSIYTKENNAIYPEFDFQANLFVVSSFSTNNGIGGRSTTSYCYKGAKTHLEGRGFRGFSEIRTIDETTGITSIKHFDRDYNFIGSPITKTETKLADGTLLSETRYFNEQEDFFGQSGTAYFSFTSKTITNNYEVDGSYISTVENRMDYDDYGNVMYNVVDYGDGHIDSTWNEYTDVIGNWILGRLSRSEVHRKAPGKPVVKRVAAFVYDPTSGLLLEETTEPDLPQEQQIVKSYVHDEFGNITQSTVTFFNGKEFESRNTFSTYDDQGRFTLSVSNDLGHTSNSIYDPIFGHPLSTIDPNGVTVTNKYDPFGRIKRVDYPDGNWTTNEYLLCNDDCPENAVFYTSTESPTSPTTYSYYDILGREVQTKTLGFNGQILKIDNTFNERGLVIATSDPYYEGDVPVWTTMEYDIIGRETMVTSPGDLTSLTDYMGLTTTVTNPLGQTKNLIKNLAGRLVFSIDNQGNQLSYDYDSQGNLVASVDPYGNSTLMTYDIYGNKTSMSDPNMGTYYYSHNTIGELLFQINPEGDTLQFDYDVLGRTIERIEPEGATRWTYDSQDYGIGKLASVMSPGYEMTIEYDELSRVIKKWNVINNEVYQISYDFDNYGRPLKTDYPSDFSIIHYYNNFGYLHEVRNYANNDLFWKADEINARGQLTKSILGNGIISEFTFNENTSWLENITSSLSSNEVQNLSYSYNNLGHLTQRSDNLLNVVENFTFDDLNRLTESEIVGGTNTILTYDKLGNITYKSDVGNYFYGENGAGPHQLTSIIGDTTLCLPSALTDFTFNSYNKVEEIKNDSGDRIELDYGASRQRIIQRTYQDTTLVETKIYLGGLYEKTIKGNTTEELHYIRGGRAGVVAVYTQKSNAPSTTHYWHKDHLGSLQSITNDTGAVITVLSYDAWGKRRNPDGTSLDSDNAAFDYDRGYTGHEHIDLFGLINMNGRIYDPVIGRFISPDPFLQEATDLQNYNRYAYVLNNPLAYTDPSGFFFKEFKRSIKRTFRNIGKRLSRAARNIAKGRIGDALNDIGQAHIDFTMSGAKATNEGGKKAFGEETWNQIVVTGATIAVGMATGGVGAGLVGTAIFSGAAAGFTGGAVSVLVAGGSTQDALNAGIRGAVIGGITAGLTYGVGSLADAAGSAAIAGGQISSKVAYYGVKIIGHGVVQGGMADLQGGKFEHGFYSGAFTAAAQPSIDWLDNNPLSTTRIVASALVGGTASELGGGKFSNGAISGAFVRMYNDNKHLQQLNKIRRYARYLSSGLKIISGVTTITGVGAGIGGIAYGLSVAIDVADAGIGLAVGVYEASQGNYSAALGEAANIGSIAIGYGFGRMTQGYDSTVGQELIKGGIEIKNNVVKDYFME